MKPRSSKATIEEKARYAKLKEMGCIISHLTMSPCRGLGCEVQHMTAGGRRISNYHTLPLCPWHHRGQLPEGHTTTYATNRLGPSFAKSRREFEMVFGSEEYLLAETNKRLSVTEHPDWLEIPKFLRRGND